jgi:hypothetical protein
MLDENAVVKSAEKTDRSTEKTTQKIEKLPRK